MKKVFTIALALILAFSLLTACGNIEKSELGDLIGVSQEKVYEKMGNPQETLNEIDVYTINGKSIRISYDENKLVNQINVNGQYVINLAKENGNDVQLHDWAKEYLELGSGLTLGLVNDHEPTENGVVYLNKITDNLNVQFANLTEIDREFILKIFYEYEEVAFKADNNNIFQNSYTFTLNAMTSLIIPITLDENLKFDNSHFLTVAVLTSPNKYAVDLDMMSDSYGMSITYELVNRNETRQINEKPMPQEPIEFLKNPYQGLMLNVDFTAKDDTQVFFPPKQLKIKSGETVRLAYRAGNYENTDDVLFIVILNWQQQRINDDKPFIHILNKPEYLGYGVIEFTAPLEKGKYEITGFIDRHPFELRSASNFCGNETCYRFTLVVE